MREISFHIRNLRGLRSFSWSPKEVSLLVGANGSGKTTVLLAIKLIRAAFDRGLPEAVAQVLGGSYGIKNREAPEEEPIELGIDVDHCRWRLSLIPSGSTVAAHTNETFHAGDTVVFRRNSLGEFEYRGQKLDIGDRLGLRYVIDAFPNQDADAGLVAETISRTTVFHDPDLWSLRMSGSRATEDRHLNSRGKNVFTILRKWQERRDDRRRFEFVLDSLQSAFPKMCADIDFDATGQTVTLRNYRPGDEDPLLVSTESNGFLAMIVALTQVANSDSGGVVLIDEPENSLHPFAAREFLRSARSWAFENSVIVVLATHSTVLLNEFASEPSLVYVLEPGMERGPHRLTDIKQQEWLNRFGLGKLYANLEFGFGHTD